MPDNAVVTYAYNQEHGLRSRESKQQLSDNQRFQQRFFPSPGVIASFNLVVRSTTYRSTMYRQFGIGFEQRKLIQLAGDRKLPKGSVGRIWRFSSVIKNFVRYVELLERDIWLCKYLWFNLNFCSAVYIMCLGLFVTECNLITKLKDL